LVLGLTSVGKYEVIIIPAIHPKDGELQEVFSYGKEDDGSRFSCERHFCMYFWDNQLFDGSQKRPKL